MSGSQGRAEESGCAENSGRWHRQSHRRGFPLGGGYMDGHQDIVSVLQR
jgi:hypothetical protein